MAAPRPRSTPDRGPMNPSNRRSGDSRIACSAGTTHDVVAETSRSRRLRASRAQQRDRGRRGRGLEADREEHDLTISGFRGRCAARQAANRPCGCRRPRAFASSKRPSLLDGTRSMSPNVVKITFRSLGDRDRVVFWCAAGSRRPGSPGRAPARSRPVAGPRFRGWEHRVRVPPADLHQLVVAAPARPQRRISPASARPSVGVAELIDVPHARACARCSASSLTSLLLTAHAACARASATPASRAAPRRQPPAPPSASSTVTHALLAGSLAGSALAARERARAVDREHRHRDCLVAAGDAELARVSHLEHHLTRSRSRAARGAPARTQRPSARAARVSRAPRARRRARARSRRGSGPSRRAPVAVQQRDVDGAPHTSDLDRRETVRLVQDLEQLAWDR